MVAAAQDNWLNEFYDGNTTKKALWDDTFQRLYVAASKGTGIDLTKVRYNSSDFELITSLLKDAGRFSTYKDNEIFYNLAQMANATPNSDAFKALAMPLMEKYKGYTQVEYDSALGTSAMAKKWQGFADNANLYPNLQYRAVMDNRTRDEHAKLHGLVLPINHPFWLTNYPPNGYGCRCSVVQTDKPADQKTPNSVADKGFDFNPGIQKRLFAESAGYYKVNNKEAVDKLALTLLAAESRKGVRANISELPTFKTSNINKLHVSNGDIKTITGKNHDDQFSRDAILWDIGRVCKDAEFIKTVPRKMDDLKHANVQAFWYYKVKGFDNMFLDVWQMNSGEFHLHAIVDKLKIPKG